MKTNQQILDFIVASIEKIEYRLEKKDDTETTIFALKIELNTLSNIYESITR